MSKQDNNLFDKFINQIIGVKPYYSKDIFKIFGIPNRQLQYWDETGIIQPSNRSAKRRIYTFDDLIYIWFIFELHKVGMKTNKIKYLIPKLKERLNKYKREELFELTFILNYKKDWVVLQIKDFQECMLRYLEGHVTFKYNKKGE